ncbi:MAG TPA: polysaccharide deacetylase family protein, partial [Nitrososphaera sp.]
YGFKATFFVICNKVGQSEDKMTWEDIATLQNEGHDIQSHSMNHEWMDRLSASELDFEIGESKSVWQTMA